MGYDRLKKLNELRGMHLKVGDNLTVKSVSHRDGTALRLPIEMEFEIVGVIGQTEETSRWSQTAFIDYAYLDRVLKDKKCELDGKVNIGWLMVDDQRAASQVAGKIEESMRDLKCETLATAYGRFLEPLKDFLRLLKFALAPAIAVVMTVIVANAIGITVRERTHEIAVLKVLGFGRVRVLALVLGEALLLGLIGGIIGGGVTHWVINKGVGGLPLGDGHFFVSSNAWWWGPAIGASTAILGGLLPALGACSVRVSEVFAKVA
jgi:putative ABC transport system permease protein